MTIYDKFPSPYVAGTILTISPDTPQSPASARSYDYTAEAAQLVQTYHFPEVAAPPPPSPRPHESGARFRELEIVQPISVEQSKAQVVLCKAALTPGQQPTYMAAKIFDIRCYGQEAWYDDELPRFAKRARVEYSREAAAYHRIRAHESTRPSFCTLGYFGAWSFQLIQAPEAARSKVCDTPQALRPTRTVNLLLLEYIEGCRLHDILFGTERFVLDDEYRLEVWARFAECETWLEHLGIRHEDIVEHNVMVTPAPKPTSKDVDGPIMQQLPRVILIDFGQAEVKELDPNIGSLPKNPIMRHWSIVLELGRWCPSWFEGDTPARRRWMMKKYSQDPRWRKVDASLDPDHLTQGEKDYMGYYGY